MKFSHEPVMWVSALIAILQVVEMLSLGGELTPAVITAATTAIGGLYARSKVVPLSDIEEL